jgi:hypothetical protein
MMVVAYAESVNAQANTEQNTTAWILALTPFNDLTVFILLII